MARGDYIINLNYKAIQCAMALYYCSTITDSYDDDDDDQVKSQSFFFSFLFGYKIQKLTRLKCSHPNRVG